MSSLKIYNLHKSYGTNEVLKDINLEIEDGGFLVLVGPSGCGKSTLLGAIAGLEDISSGEIWIGGQSMEGLHPSKRDIAMVFQSYALYPNMTVAQNISFGMEIRGVDKAVQKKAIEDVSSMLQINELLKRKPSQLSGGQRQRVAIGRALVRDPQVFLFDEPLSNLDAKLRVEMRTEIKRLHAQMKTTIVYVTHDQIEALTLATKIAVLKDGVLQQFGTPNEIYSNPENVFVATFMGSPAMNLMEAVVTKHKKDHILQIRSAGKADLKIPVKDFTPLEEYVGKTILFGIRPEDLTDDKETEKKQTNVVHKNCLIEIVEPAGSDTFVVTNLGGHSVVARLRSDSDIQAGKEIQLAFNMSKAVFFDSDSELRIR